MDFLKTLLIYLTVTTAMGVQNAVPVSQVPEPTQIPVVTFAPSEATPAVTAVPEATPAPTKAVAKTTRVPEPTVTPNKAYSLLKRGSKGDDVRKLQTRLKELGYLSGSIDGSYGNGTRAAVIAFQRANGLSADGEAGRNTQTILFENPHVIAADGTIWGPYTETTPAPEPLAVETIAPLEFQSFSGVTVDSTIDNALIVYNSSGEPLTVLRREDGVMVLRRPQVYQMTDGSVAVSMVDLCDAIDGWELYPYEDGTGFGFSALGYSFDFELIGDAISCTLDGKQFSFMPVDITFRDEDLLLRSDFLGRMLSGTAIWEPDESTLLLQFSSRAVNDAKD